MLDPALPACQGLLTRKISAGVFRNQTRRPFSFTSRPTSPSSAVSPLGALSRTIAQNGTEGTKSKGFFPPVSHKSVAYWLLGSAASVFGIVVFGGLTRLTESGLSITEWRPVTGSLPPVDDSAWQSEFDKYRASPEFKILNPNMDLSEFKKIYWMEWTHRLWGRVIGVTFLVPTVYFILRRRVSRPMALRLLGITSLIGFQGFLGWWMVKSGLKDDLFTSGSQPRVSQYRLAAHLGAAFLVYVSMLWNGLSILRTHTLLSRLTPTPIHAHEIHSFKSIPSPQNLLHSLQSTLHARTFRPFRLSVLALGLLVFTTAISGAFVAGLDAGLIYNDFPYMGLGLTPPKRELFDPFYSRQPDPHPDLVWRNAFENPSLVQLDHRILATTTFTAVMALWAWTRFGRRFRGTVFPAEVWKGVRGVVHLVWLQVTLGISTLLYLVPTPLAAAHQAGSLALLTGVVVLGSRVCLPRIVQMALKNPRAATKMGLVPTRRLGERAKGDGMKFLNAQE
ncbi:COX15-CtaA-domain-containing protein [Viridothelium virens]|uniref:COX15-CtaA-domain-containing protein n=1 Tax=Viridothelium virens TaxID=1048519 RepID=A0A6A6GUX1_VIRVR|nr:COX15-CtaA-domain-containing protein [Viridothelium virens]